MFFSAAAVQSHQDCFVFTILMKMNAVHLFEQPQNKIIYQLKNCYHIFYLGLHRKIFARFPVMLCIGTQ